MERVVMLFTCPQCKQIKSIEAGRFNCAQRKGLSVYCGRVCSGIARRRENPVSKNKEYKAAYDAKRRVVLKDRIKAEKAARHKATYDPQKAAILRKERMPYHLAYCRQPEYRAWKSEYDRKYLASKQFGDFADAALILRQIEQEVSERITSTEIAQQNGTLNKVQTRRRDYERITNKTQRS